MRYLAAITVILIYVAFCLICWKKYRQRERMADKHIELAQDAVLIAYASQTGNAEHLAQKSAQQLQQAGLLPFTEAVPYVPHSESVKLLMQSSVLLLAFAEASALLANIPGKLFEYLASGKPILAVGAKASSTEAILQECQAGELFAYEDKAGIKAHLHQLCDQWLQNPNLDLTHQMYQRYSRMNLTGELAELLRELAERE